MIGRTLGHYRIVEKIGAGGMGEVYRAHDEQLDRDVALKVLPSAMLADEPARKQFRKEALALSRLNHPGIETVFEFATEDDVDFLALDLIQGTRGDGRILNSNDRGLRFEVVSNPEFLAERTAIKDLEQPDRVLVGSRQTPAGIRARRAVADLYAMWVPRDRFPVRHRAECESGRDILRGWRRDSRCKSHTGFD
jgi:Protein kinase domain/UDP-glucose/GDP-mannose dehydrogenase family, NAD binding domain